MKRLTDKGYWDIVHNRNDVGENSRSLGAKAKVLVKRLSIGDRAHSNELFCHIYRREDIVEASAMFGKKQSLHVRPR